MIFGLLCTLLLIVERTAATTNTQHLPSPPIISVLQCRGGGMGNAVGDVVAAIPRNPLALFRRTTKTRKQNPLAELQTQIQMLEEQIKLAREESRQLKLLLTKSKRKVLTTTDAEISESGKLQKQLLQEQQTHRSELAGLAKQIEQMEIVRKEMVVLLEAETKRAVELQAELEAAQKLMLQKDELAQNELNALRSTAAASRAEIAALEARNAQTQATAKLELEKLRDAITMASKAEILSLETRNAARFTKESLQWKKDMDGRLSEVRERGEAAVEVEKVKMRKLVKALADMEKREAKLVAAALVEKKKKELVAAQEKKKKQTMAASTAKRGGKVTSVVGKSKSTEKKIGSTARTV
eukprot:CAMPEP_0194375968 /NCGR_PEP_ID=MMETSP0174-20130528/24516_1 /TAXON_ID=216777 /ORGANISM="Proboscia alata, Strain PI-D3" /LENGTH=354 /DNA_ID=CAMNT_0039156495 /DNA_START=122 /DNA_END=1186 /DNA_ORIENTATION=+